VLIVATVFHLLPDEIDISVMPLFSGIALVLAGTISLIYKPEELAEVAVRSSVLGGTVGAGFWLAGICQVVTPS
jgi:hypothetical protein